RLAAAHPCPAALVPGCRGFLLSGDFLPPRVSAILLQADALPVLRVNRHDSSRVRVPAPPGRGSPLPPTSWRYRQRAVTSPGPAGTRPPCVAPHPAPAAADNAGLHLRVPHAPEPPGPCGRNAPPRHRPVAPCSGRQHAAHTP